MKLKFHDSAGDDVRSLVWPKEVGGSSLRRLPARQRGIALVVTLILLAVVTFMAVTFLALSRRERGAVTTVTDTATARLAADAALANAQAQIIANIFATTNAYAYDYGLLVSTNYINANGFNPAAGANPTNVNYYDSSGNFLTGNNFLTNVANLYYLPRAPVFVPSPPDNYVNPTNYDFRFYLDLNRNGRFDTNGVVANVDNNNKTVGTGTIAEVGDPEWIGILEHPDAPHGPNNPFIARYAFIAMPADNALDLNYIHNQVFDEPSSPTTAAISVNPPPTSDGFFRNQGVGSWEINLAAFLADLNTNEWGQVIGTPANGNDTYYYYQYLSKDNQGDAFSDARALLAYRYSNNYNSLTNADALFTNMAAYPYNIDLYSDGPLQTTFNTNANLYPDSPDLPWAGADNTNHFFDMQELFNAGETAMGVSSAQITAGNDFSDRLLNAGTNTFGGSTVSTYDRYTFYRLLSQLGTDSSAESGKLNLNYRNVTNGVIIPGMETNFYPWTALEFFTNAADRMLRLYTTNWFQTNPSNYLATYYGIAGAAANYYHLDAVGDTVTNDPSGFGLTNVFLGTNTVPAFGIENIPVSVNGNFAYSSPVQRVLQLAANIYDASTTNFYPSVFRPTFLVTNQDGYNNVYVDGYSLVPDVSGTSDVQLSKPVDVTTLSLGQSALNVYGVPWIIGAKKGFPNFNEFSMENIIGVTRRLQFTRQTNSSKLDITGTNQMYMMSINSSLGVELWNSYNSNYSGSIIVSLSESNSMTLTNDEGLNWSPLSPMIFSTNETFTFPLDSWPGSMPWTAVPPFGQPNTNSFFLPLNVTLTMLTNSVYRSHYASGATLPSGFGFTAPCLIPTNYFYTSTQLFETNSPNGFHFPQFGLQTTNRLQVYMLDSANGTYHVIDYVQFAGPDRSLNLNTNIADIDSVNSYAGVWDTNYPSGQSPPDGVTYGIINQMDISKSGAVPAEDGSWNADPESLATGTTLAAQIAYFQAFFLSGNRATATINGVTATATNLLLSVQAPYSPTRYAVQYITWQANDPLVHYLASDIDSPLTNATAAIHNSYNAGTIIPTLTSLNLGQLNYNYQPWGGSPYQHPANPLDYSMTVKDPLIWQSDDWNFPTNKFPTVGWLGRVHRGTPWQTVYLKYPGIDTNSWANWTENFNVNDAINAMPVQDRLLFDLFTTAPNDNATRGQLSINGASLAAWSALLSGMVVLTNVTVSPSQATTPSNNWFTINPAGGNGLNSPLGDLVTNIYNTRTNFPLQVFGHVGDILSVPQLTQESPFLNWNNTAQQDYGISDEMYEWLPQQMMSLLRVSSVPRYVIYSYGQTLKPAPNGISTASGSFGLVTNYQIVSETATRAVVQVHSTLVTNNLNHLVTTNYSTTIEQFNTLPSD